MVITHRNYQKHHKDKANTTQDEFCSWQTMKITANDKSKDCFGEQNKETRQTFLA